jgi:hypothetical protein
MSNSGNSSDRASGIIPHFQSLLVDYLSASRYRHRCCSLQRFLAQKLFAKSFTTKRLYILPRARRMMMIKRINPNPPLG